jgi:hypothetical protein
MESAPGVTDREEEVSGLGVNRAVAAFAVGGLAVALGVLPAIVGLGLFPAGGAAWALAGLGGVAGVWGGAKLAVAACSLVSAWPGSQSRPERIAEID